MRSKHGFTLVELLVVITIIGILIALLLPAVQSARESARMVQCKNNLRQLALGCLMHEQVQGHFPANGFNYRWAGDPNRGFGADQPGGWLYNILPFIEQSALRELGKDLDDAGRRAAGAQVAGTVVSTFICPSRGAAEPFDYTLGGGRYGFMNLNPPKITRSDYAGNAGNRESGWCAYNTTNHTGVIYSRDGLPAALIRDGASNTYLIGERYIVPEHYNAPGSSGNDQGWMSGHDFDVFRCTDYRANDPTTSAIYAPRQDRSGVDVREMFGSAHAVFHMAMCDGSVQGVSYSIDPEVHWRLGNRKDGESASLGSL